jgi:hypothetical protein
VASPCAASEATRRFGNIHFSLASRLCSRSQIYTPPIESIIARTPGEELDKRKEKSPMDGPGLLTLMALLSLAFLAGMFAHWIATREQRRQLKRYKQLFASLGDVIPQRTSKRVGKRRRNGR